MICCVQFVSPICLGPWQSLMICGVELLQLETPFVVYSQVVQSPVWFVLTSKFVVWFLWDVVRLEGLWFGLFSHPSLLSGFCGMLWGLRGSFKLICWLHENGAQDLTISSMSRSMLTQTEPLARVCIFPLLGVHSVIAVVCLSVGSWEWECVSPLGLLHQRLLIHHDNSRMRKGVLGNLILCWAILGW